MIKFSVNTMSHSLYPTMLQEYLIARLSGIRQKRIELLDSIKTSVDAAEYIENVRKKLRRCFGCLPKRTPLNLRVVCEKKHDGYTRQNIIFESRPDYFVTGCLYIPTGDEKVPCVLGICGHSPDGKADSTYQSFCIGLASQGYMVLMTDPVSQGERWQYPDDEPGKCWNGKRIVYEHNMMGKSQRLAGDFLGTWRLWDKMRALDVLLGHPRADHTRVGVTGTSGGGTLSSYLFALDNRVTMLAAGCYITTYLHNLENTLPCDAEQMIPHMLEYGLDMGDLLLAGAPKPALILAQEYDFFDVRGTHETFEQCRRIYNLLGYEANVRLTVDTETHGYSKVHRESMYDFFNHHTGHKACPCEENLGILPESEDNLLAADGDVNTMGSRRLCEFTAETARLLWRNRKRISKQEKIVQLKKLLKLPKRNSICNYRNSRFKRYDLNEKNVIFARQTQYLIESEPGIIAFLCRFMSNDKYPFAYKLNATEDLELFIPDRSAEMEVNVVAGTVMGKKVSGDAWIIEPRGMGHSIPLDISGYKFDDPYGLDYMMSTTFEMLGETLIGGRIHDVLCTLDLLVDRGAKHIVLTGRGLGAIIAKLSGCLHDKVEKVNCMEAPPTFYEISQKPLDSIPWSAIVPNILKYFDWNEL